MLLVKIRSRFSVALGILLFVFLLLGLFVSNQIDLTYIYALLFSFFFILNGFEGKTAIVNIIFGFALLITVFIWLITQEASLSSFDVIIGIITGILAIVLGTAVSLGILSEKWIKGNLE